MAHKKGVGSTDNGRDSNSKRLGVKLFGGQSARAGNIIIRQRGTKYHPGSNAYMGKDYTIHAAIDGKVVFSKGKRNRTFVGIETEEIETVATAQNGSNGSSIKNAATAPTANDNNGDKAQPKTENSAADADVTVTVDATVDGTVSDGPVRQDDAPDLPADGPGGDVTDQAELAVADNEQGGALNTAEVTGSDMPNAVVLPSGRKIELDDLTVIDGIDPATAGILSAAGFNSWRGLAEADADFVKEQLAGAGSQYEADDISGWQKQATLAADEQWAELEKLQQG